MLAMLGEVEEGGVSLSCLLWVVVGLVVKVFSGALEGFFLNSLVTREGVRGLLLGCDRVEVMLGDVGSEGAGSVFVVVRGGVGGGEGSEVVKLLLLLVLTAVMLMMFLIITLFIRCRERASDLW